MIDSSWNGGRNLESKDKIIGVLGEWCNDNEGLDGGSSVSL